MFVFSEQISCHNIFYCRQDDSDNSTYCVTNYWYRHLNFFIKINILHIFYHNYFFLKFHLMNIEISKNCRIKFSFLTSFPIFFINASQLFILIYARIIVFIVICPSSQIKTRKLNNAHVDLDLARTHARTHAQTFV